MERPLVVAPGVERFAALTPTLAPATHTNSYALGERQVLLVEPATPYDDEQRAWLGWARGLASQGRELVAIFATHHHPDHVGGAEALAGELGVPIWAHEATAARMAAPVTRRLAEGETIVLDGASPQRWEVLLTPGHALGHLCLVERVLGVGVVGDMVASVGTILIDPREGDMIDYLAGLARLEALGLATALPAHGDPIGAPSALFRRYREHRRMREALVERALLAAPGATLDGLLPGAYGDTPELLWPIARLSLESHLVKLVREGRAHTDGDRWFVAS